MDTAAIPPIEVLEGPAIRLRQWRPTDINAVLEAASDPNITLISSLPPNASRDDAAAFIDRQVKRPVTDQAHALAVVVSAESPDHSDATEPTNATDRAVGHLFVDLADVGLGRVTMGYWVLASNRGKGTAARALSLATQWVFASTGANRITLYIEPHNEGSRHTAARAGFVEEALVQAWATYADGVPRDMQVWVLLRDGIGG
jgi:RimJ/RimL family protein N-acetyltransferase